MADTEYHGWPYGSGTVATTTAWSPQPAVTALGLSLAHLVTERASGVVAVLDTGEDLTQPALAGPSLAGWNYVDDNADTSDPANGTDGNHRRRDSAAGHGTFVAGMVRLVAPERDPARAGAGRRRQRRHVRRRGSDRGRGGGRRESDRPELRDRRQGRLAGARRRWPAAQQAGVVVTVAAGNDARTMPHYPAALPGVVSVEAMNAGRSASRRSPTAAGGPRSLQPAIPRRADARPALGTWSGTSMAAPFVSGQVALLLSAAAPQLTGSQLVAAVDLTGSRLLGTSTSHGAINVPASLQRVTQH